jgi:hypothetical protein
LEADAENDEKEEARLEKKRPRASNLVSVMDGDVVYTERELSSAASEVSGASAPASPVKRVELEPAAAALEASAVSPVAAVPASPAAAPSPGSSASARKRGPGQRISRELRRLTEEVFDGVYWRTSVTTTTTTTTTTDAGTVVETLQEVEEKLVREDEVARQQEGEEAQSEEDEEFGDEEHVEAAPPVQLQNEEMAGAYLHSEAVRLRQAKEFGNLFVPDLNGQVSMDGEYWKISSSGRRRQQRQLEFFPRSLKLGSSAPSVPRPPLSPESQARRRAEQSRLTAERRQAREEQQVRDNEAFAELVTFLSAGREIVPLLFLGGEIAAEHTAWVEAHVDFIVNCSGKRFAYGKQFVGEERLMTIDIDDNVHCDMTPHFGIVAERVEAALASGRRVFVHCRQGRSRSAALVAAFLVLKRDMSLSAALQLIAEKNRGHSINEGFLRQLQVLECAHYGLAVSSIFQSKETRRQ